MELLFLLLLPIVPCVVVSPVTLGTDGLYDMSAQLLSRTQAQGANLDFWWNCRNFVLNDDLSLDYDMGGLAVSATFLINVVLFVTFIVQVAYQHTLFF